MITASSTGSWHPSFNPATRVSLSNGCVHNCHPSGFQATRAIYSRWRTPPNRQFEWTVLYRVREMLVDERKGNNDIAKLDNHDLYRILRIL